MEWIASCYAYNLHNAHLFYLGQIRDFHLDNLDNKCTHQLFSQLIVRPQFPTTSTTVGDTFQGSGTWVPPVDFNHRDSVTCALNPLDFGSSTGYV